MRSILLLGPLLLCPLGVGLGLAQVGTPYCFGDGSATQCPCGNNSSQSGEGCLNSTGVGGTLSDTGSDSILAGDLVLHASGVVPNQAGVFFQGNNRINGGFGNQFGDGLRCAGGAGIQLQVRMANAGGSTHTTVNVPSLGGVIEGDIKHYQYWYRDPVFSPCGFKFNFTNGLSITWST